MNTDILKTDIRRTDRVQTCNRYVYARPGCPFQNIVGHLG